MWRAMTRAAEILEDVARYLNDSEVRPDGSWDDDKAKRDHDEALALAKILRTTSAPRDRELVDELIERTARRLERPIMATDDMRLRDMLFDIGKLIASRDGRDEEIRLNPPKPVDPKA